MDVCWSLFYTGVGPPSNTSASDVPCNIYDCYPSYQTNELNPLLDSSSTPSHTGKLEFSCWKCLIYGYLRIYSQNSIYEVLKIKLLSKKMIMPIARLTVDTSAARTKPRLAFKEKNLFDLKSCFFFKIIYNN